MSPMDCTSRQSEDAPACCYGPAVQPALVSLLPAPCHCLQGWQSNPRRDGAASGHANMPSKRPVPVCSVPTPLVLFSNSAFGEHQRTSRSTPLLPMGCSVSAAVQRQQHGCEKAADSLRPQCLSRRGWLGTGAVGSHGQGHLL